MWLIMLVALLLAFLIWRYFDIRIEKLKTGMFILFNSPFDSNYFFSL